MKKELNLVLCKSYTSGKNSCLDDNGICKYTNIKIDDYMFDSLDDNQVESITDIKNYGYNRITIARYINHYAEILKSLFQKHDIDLNEIEKISIYVISDSDIEKYMYYFLNACSKLRIDYIDLYKREPNDPRGYYKYQINVDSFKSRVALHFELIKGYSTDIDAITLFDENINKIISPDILYDILANQFEFYFDTIYILAKECYIYPNIHLYIPEVIYDHLEEFLLTIRLLHHKKSRYETLFIHCKDKVDEVNLW